MKINGKDYNIPPLSKLSVEQYLILIDKMRYINIISYISALSGVDIDNAKVEIKDIDYIERYLLDVDVDFTKIETPKYYDNKVVASMYDGTFGSMYKFNLYRLQLDAENISIYELCVYALAIVLHKENGKEIETIYNELLKENWMTILPIGFFLSKRLKARRRYLMTFLMTSIYKCWSRIKIPKLKKVLRTHTQ